MWGGADAWMVSRSEILDYLSSPFDDALVEICERSHGRPQGRTLARAHPWRLSALLAYLDEDASACVARARSGGRGATAGECVRRVQEALAPVLSEAREQIIIGAELRPSTA